MSYRFEVIADCCLNFGHFAFLSPLWKAQGQRKLFVLGSLESATLVLIELFR